MSDRREYKVIAIDFDGTMFETEYPKILRPILPVIEMAKARKAAGDKLILWTCRDGPELEAAIEACRQQGLEFDAVNDNLPEMKEKWGDNPRKVGADEYWDDRNYFMSLMTDQYRNWWFTWKCENELLKNMVGVTHHNEFSDMELHG